MKPFDLFRAPLSGTQLIEASAGTGKTYAIESLFVRLALEKELLPSQILVVTFTQSATNELKERIYRKLVAVRRAFSGRPQNDDFIARYCSEFAEPGRGMRLVQQAISEFDRAAIFTIHGLCQRILYDNAFETGKLFDTELIEDQSPFTRKIARDFWRNHLYHQSPEVIAFVMNRISGPDALAGLLKVGADELVRVLPDISHMPEMNSLEEFQKAARVVKSRWAGDRDAVNEAFFALSLSGTVFGGVKPGKGGGLSQRQIRVTNLLASMDLFCSTAPTVPPLFKDFAKFTTSGLIRATRKNQVTPEHAFFECCEQLSSAASALAGELESYLSWFKAHAFEDLRTELPQRKKKLNVQYFDDLLIRVKRALESPGGEALADSVRRRYRAAMVDEFQDTDRVQYDIFARFFAKRQTPFFLIGDPKQAIYGFRGADIFTYMQAARQCRQKHTLRENWRSSAGLIAAVNTIFDSAPVPFVYDEIGFEPGTSAGAAQPDFGMPMTIWYLDSSKYANKGKPVPKYVAEPLIINALAAEISSLLNQSEPKVTASDIAVLVRTNKQARLVKDGLNDSGIPAVLHSTGNIFDSAESSELEVLLNCIAHPNNSRKLRAALVTQIWGKTAGELQSIENDPEIWQGLLERISNYHHLWQNDGYMRMFRQVLTKEDMAVRLIGLPNGERRLTNLLHLSEILHRNASEKRLNMPALINWLAEQRNPDAQRLEALHLRMESDDEAVKIVTIHKSKGLEYPVVFCPFSWEDSRLHGNELQYHDPRSGYLPTLNLSVQPDDECRKWAQNEHLAENLRLLYVALTRAKNKCYLVWGRIRAADTSALAYLLHARIRLDEKIDKSDAVALLSKSMSGLLDHDYLADLKYLAGRQPDCLSIAPLPERPPNRIRQTDSDLKLNFRKFKGVIDRTQSIISYSTMIARRSTDADLPDHDDAAGRWLSRMPVQPFDPNDSAGEDGSDIFGFVKGARAGIFFHDLFEQMSFDLSDRESRSALVSLKLEEHGFESWWQSVISGLLQELLELELPSVEAGFHLGQLKTDQRVHELEFYFPLKKLTPNHLARLLEPHFIRPERLAELNRIRNLTFNTAQGFVKGFIDMVFSHEGKYYLVDWKSNYLGSTVEDYRYESLKAAMAEHLYGLQSLLYSLALDQYLRVKIPDYHYDSHFGGAYYFFLRGVRSELGEPYGVFRDRLTNETIHALRDAMIG